MSSNPPVSKRIQERQARIEQELIEQEVSIRDFAKLLGSDWENTRKIIPKGDMSLDLAQRVCDGFGRDLIWLSKGHNGGQRLSGVMLKLIDLCEARPEYADIAMELVEKMWKNECQD